MPETTKFPYTATWRTYLTRILPLSFLMLVESSVLFLLIAVLVHNIPLKTVLLVACGGLLLYMIFGLLLAPLWTAHHLTATHLQLHYGTHLNIALPRNEILSAQPIQKRLLLFQSVSASYETEKRQITAVFSDQGQLVLHLKHPLPLTIRGKVQPTESLLINVNQRDELLAALTPSISTEAIGIFCHDEVTTGRQDEIVQLSRVRKARTEEHVSDGDAAIHIAGLRRTFDSFVAVDNLHMAIQPGEVYGFLGSNGAGKTTTIRMLGGLLQPTSGRIEIAGHDIAIDPVAAKTAFGYVADHSILYERLTGREFLAFLGQVRGLPQTEIEQRISYLLDLLDLTGSAEQLCGSYSFGMKRKLSLAGALLHSPSVLILDEPLNGLDPRSSRHVRDLLLELAAGGTAILLSTHDMAIAEAICHRVGILHKGRLLVEGSAADLRHLASAPDLESLFLDLTEKQAGEVASQ